MNPFAALYSRPVRVGVDVKAISFYSESYRKEIEPFHRSCIKFGVHHETRFVDKPTWLDAVIHKPRFILSMLRETEAQALFWADADSEWKSKPDFSIFKGCGVSWHGFVRGPNAQLELLTGSMYFANNPNVRLFLEDWANESEREIYRDRFTPEQDSLRLVWEHKGWKQRLKHLQLPPAWIAFDDMRQVYPELEPVLWHRQVSRKYRHEKKEAAKEKETNATTPEAKT